MDVGDHDGGDHYDDCVVHGLDELRIFDRREKKKELLVAYEN